MNPRDWQVRARLAVLVAALGIVVATLGIGTPEIGSAAPVMLACAGPCGDPGGGGG